jgi:aquaporin Z
MKKYIAELIGTFTLVFFGCGTVIFMGDKAGVTGIAIAFGLTVVAMAYSIGHISGAHLNPAVSVGALVAGRLPMSDFIGYVVGQVAGGILAAFALYLIATGKTGGYDFATKGFATSGWSDYGMVSAFLYETIATFIFLTVILGATQTGPASPFAGLVIGLTLTMIHLGGITVSGASVNPARSIGPALFYPAALGPLWLYIVAPCLGAAIAGFVFKAGITRAGD